MLLHYRNLPMNTLRYDFFALDCTGFRAWLNFWVKTIFGQRQWRIENIPSGKVNHSWFSLRIRSKCKANVWFSLPNYIYVLNLLISVAMRFMISFHLQKYWMHFFKVMNFFEDLMLRAMPSSTSYEGNLFVDATRWPAEDS